MSDIILTLLVNTFASIVLVGLGVVLGAHPTQDDFMVILGIINIIDLILFVGKKVKQLVQE